MPPFAIPFSALFESLGLSAACGQSKLRKLRFDEGQSYQHLCSVSIRYITQCKGVWIPLVDSMYDVPKNPVTTAPADANATVDVLMEEDILTADTESR